MTDGDELVRLALSRPAEALVAADRVIAGRAGAESLSYARQARGIVLRDAGRLAEAIRELRLAVRLARSTGDHDRVADIEATLGAALVMAGRTAAGLSTLDAVIAASTGRQRGRALMRRGYLLATLGRRDDALADLDRAVVLLRRAGDPLWEARARMSRFNVHTDAGRAARAHRDLDIAQRLFTEAGQEFEAAMTVHNRADLAAQEGDLPAAMALLDQASARYAEVGATSVDLVFDRCKVLLAAGLAAEALAEADAAVARLAENSAGRAEMLFAAARAAQAAGRPGDAAVRAAAARDLFRAQHRAWWGARAAFVLVQSRYDAGERDGRLRAEAGRIADLLDELGAEEAPAAHLLAGRLAAAGKRYDDAERHLERAARLRRGGPTYGHAAGWLAHAIRADARGTTAPALRACRRGLVAAAEHQRRLGAVELRVHAAAYGTELAAIGQRHAVRRGDARMLLRWSELWRAGALAPDSARPPADRALDADLAALRDVMSRFDDARARGAPAGHLDVERRRLEQAIRARTRRAAGRAQQSSGPRGIAVGEVLDGLGDHLLVDLVALDGTLYVVTARPGRVRLHEAGPLAAAVREVELARFMLRRLAHGNAPPGAGERLAVAGSRLQDALLGPAVSDLDGRPVVLAPAAVLHAVPWAMLPRLRDTAWCVAPSAALWLRARRRRPPRHPRTVIVAGPGLPGSEAELAGIAAGYRSPAVLAGGDATAARVLAAIDGAATVHLTAHGVFRGDNPLFSSLRLDDGPLTLHDLGRLRRGPYRMILSSCESGVASPVAGDELLGMVSVLVPLGTASLLASVVPVNDRAAAALMADFHAGLRTGSDFADALRCARTRAPDDPVAAATALAFAALGG